ncbi:MAG: MMPL family transporter [Planctomycetota bacterium]
MRTFFRFVTSHPVPVLIVASLSAALAAPFVLTLERNTSPDAFIPPAHQALVLKNEVDALFGLSDVIAVAVVRDRKGGIFHPPTLRLIQSLTEDLLALPGLQPGDVMSLTTESGVYFEEGEPGFRRFLGRVPETVEELEALKRDFLGYELYRGTLVAADGSAASILIRPQTEAQADVIYRALQERLRETPVSDEQLAVAGEAAVRAHMGSAVSDDALRMNFVCPVVMALLIILAYRTVRGTVLPLCVIGAACTLALGTMGAAGEPVYIVTNGIFVVIMALGVADSLHLMGQYYEEQFRPAGRTQQELIVDSCVTLWSPILMTSITDFVGFFSLFLAGAMPPIKSFGLFTCVGITGALLYSCTLVPAGLAIRPLAMSKVFLARRAAAGATGRLDSLGRAMAALGTLVHRHRYGVLAVSCGLLAFAGWAASKLVVNDARILAFKDHHPIVQATRILNERFDGTGHLNITLSAQQNGAMLDPKVLASINELEAFTETLPFVGGTHSLAGWVKRAHQKMHNEDPAFYAIPEDRDDTRFYLDVLSAKTSPMARSLAEVVDRDYRQTNLIVRMRSTEFIHQRTVVEALERDLNQRFSSGSLQARLTGRAYLDYQWLRLIWSTHLNSMTISLLCVLLLTALMFRSLAAGLLCTITVSVAVLVNYAVMGLGGIPLGVGTSMFASIAIGTGINAPIHLLERLRCALLRPGADAAAVFQEASAYTGRVLLFTGTIIAVGFLLLCVSQFRTLNEFGLLIGLSMLVSFLTSVTLLPALVAVWRPRFLWRAACGPAQGGASSSS